MSSLPKDLRNKLERTIVEAREVAEAAAQAALEALAVGEAKPFAHMTPEDRALRNRLRERGRAAGDLREAGSGRQSIDHLAQLVAYEHWHRMLFARFLAENNLLLEPQYQVALSLTDVAELAREESRDVWDLAGDYAQRMLPGVFRNDDAALEVGLAREDRMKLEGLLAGLKKEVFESSDALGWTYQFWQTQRKKDVNAAEVPIGADEIAPVTQLFTEDYMVEFLIHNTLGAWWAGKRSSAVPAEESGGIEAADEAEARRIVSLPPKDGLPGIDWTYLRFVRTSEEEDQELSEDRNPDPASCPPSPVSWKPAAGTFDAWPDAVKQIDVLDPCMGSGHFLVFLLPVLSRLRMEEEELSADEAVVAVLTDNLHGLEIDDRCCQIGAFNLALAAWKLGGYQQLPPLHIACSGLTVNAGKEDWKAIGLEDHNLRLAMNWLHDSFKKAPELGSLINPKRGEASKLATGGELMRALDQAMAGESNDVQHESAVVAQGLAKAATLLGGQYQWVITNVPYLARGKQGTILQEFCEDHYDTAKNDLATVFLERCLEFCRKGGTTNVVLPQNWLFLTSYRKFREQLLTRDTWHLIARLGPGAFDTISGEVVKAILIEISRGGASAGAGELFGSESASNPIRGLDVSEPRTAAEKAVGLLAEKIKSVDQARQLENPDARVAFDDVQGDLLEEYGLAYIGQRSGDGPLYIQYHWEHAEISNGWVLFGTTVKDTVPFGGNTQIFLWENGKGQLAEYQAELARTKYASGGWKQGWQAWGQKGIRVSQMSVLPVTHHCKPHFDNNCATFVPKDLTLLPAIWCFCSSPEYNEAVRQIDQSLKVTNATLVKVPFDLDRWQKVADEKYPNGLPEPYSDDPTQWIFHGHPFGSVIWDEESKKTAHGPLRSDDTVLQVAVARLLGYRWPAELDPEMELAAEQREWVERCGELLEFADPDGIACLNPLRGEAKAAERLRTLLQAANPDWREQDLIAATGSKKKDLESWLRDDFFAQHLKLFQNRPFIWHIWDGQPDGFHALVNYHQLAAPDGAGYKLLNTLTYAYLGDWIRRQQDDVKNEVPGAQDRLEAAQALQQELANILAGEPPYDLFIRWKPLHQQPIGWNPDINDGVRLNIRPFLQAKDVGKKGAGLLRAKPTSIKWTKDRGKEPQRKKEDFPWFWSWDEKTQNFTGGETFDGNRWNDLHYSVQAKETTRAKLN